MKPQKKEEHQVCLWRENGPANVLCRLPVVTILATGKYLTPVCKRHEPMARARGWGDQEDILT